MGNTDSRGPSQHGMADPVNCSVNNGDSSLSYDRSAGPLRDYRKGDFSFDVVDADGGQQVAVFQIRKSGNVERENVSRPFPAGAIAKRSMDVGSEVCKVKVKKRSDIDLKDYFH
ncbi:uncharacterized protein LOC106011554 [Aplysia californica]|uniref:Uncharacterized protein LOC106011554 n=1 Tax=Aplysia californica TaxID=6500 RepID=A0ABM0ZYE8_APLCA|nr:uncharacterized protein LOC106011554 [Aplysia californica]